MRVAAMISLALRASIVLGVLALGLRATWRDATFLLRAPYLLVSSFVSMYVVMPAVAVALVTSFELDPAVKVAIVALALSPVPPFLPQSELRVGGEAQYTIGLLVASAVLSIAVVPLALVFFHRTLGVPLGLSIGELVRVLAISVVVPLVMGMLLRARNPRSADRLARPLARIATGVIVLASVAIIASRWHGLVALIGDGTLLVLIVFSIVGVVVGHALAGPAPEHRTVLAQSTAARHPAVALVIAQATFPGQPNAVPAALWALLAGSVVTAIYGARARRRRLAVPAAVTGATRRAGSASRSA